VEDAQTATVYVPLATAQKILGLEGKTSGLLVRWGAPGDRAAPPPPEATLPPPSARPDWAEAIDLGEGDAGAAGAAGAASAAGSGSAKPVPTSSAALPKPESGRAALLGHEMVAGIQSRDETVNTTREYMKEQRASIFPFLTVGALLSFMSILSVLAVLLLEREVEYATLRGMGYGRKEIATIIFTEVGVLSLAGLVAGALAWMALASLLIRIISRSWFPLPPAYLPADFGSVAVPTIVFLALAAAVGVRRILRINLREALGARTIG
jgi:hypothetical protein